MVLRAGRCAGRCTRACVPCVVWHRYELALNTFYDGFTQLFNLACAVDTPDVLNTKWPRRVDEISNEWLSALMGRTVTKHTKKLLEDGALSDACIVSLTFDAGDARAGRGVDSVVLKYAKANDASRLAAVNAGSYEKECHAYDSVKDILGLKTPDCYGVFREEGSYEWFCICMENLALDNEELDQTKGISVEEQRELVHIIANFNGKHYKNPEIMTQPWVFPKDDDKYLPFFAPYFDAFAADPSSYDGLQAAFDRAPERKMSLTNHDDPYLIAITKFMQGPKGVATANKLYEIWATRPMTLLHGDTRSNNIFKSKTDGSYTFIDWQMIGAGPPGIELVQLMSASMAGTVGNLPNYAEIPKLVEEYYEVLIAAAPELATDGYTLDLCKQDFSLALVPLYFGCCCAIGPMFFELPLDNGLWPFLEVSS